MPEAWLRTECRRRDRARSCRRPGCPDHPGRRRASATGGLARLLVVVVVSTAATAEVARSATADAATAALAATVKHGQRRVEALQHDFRRVAVVAGLVLPFAGLQRAFDIELGALLDILLDDLAQALVEDDDGVPLGLLAALTAVAVAPGFRCRDAQVGDRPAVLRAPDFRVCPDISDQDHLVDATSHSCFSRGFAAPPARLSNFKNAHLSGP